MELTYVKEVCSFYFFDTFCSILIMNFSDVKHVGTECKFVADIVFLLDASTSITLENWKKVVNLVGEIIHLLDVGPEKGLFQLPHFVLFFLFFYNFACFCQSALESYHSHQMFE